MRAGAGRLHFVLAQQRHRARPELARGPRRGRGLRARRRRRRADDRPSRPAGPAHAGPFRGRRRSRLVEAAFFRAGSALGQALRGRARGAPGREVRLGLGGHGLLPAAAPSRPAAAAGARRLRAPLGAGTMAKMPSATRRRTDLDNRARLASKWMTRRPGATTPPTCSRSAPRRGSGRRPPVTFVAVVCRRPLEGLAALLARPARLAGRAAGRSAGGFLGGGTRRRRRPARRGRPLAAAAAFRRPGRRAYAHGYNLLLARARGETLVVLRTTCSSRKAGSTACRPRSARRRRRRVAAPAWAATARAEDGRAPALRAGTAA